MSQVDVSARPSKPSTRRTVTVEEWRADGIRRFGKDQMKWRFKCPSCHHEACAEDWKAAGAPENAECATAGVPFFMKQMTAKMPIPDDLLVRQFPSAH